MDETTTLDWAANGPASPLEQALEDTRRTDFARRHLQLCLEYDLMITPALGFRPLQDLGGYLLTAQSSIEPLSPQARTALQQQLQALPG